MKLGKLARVLTSTVVMASLMFGLLPNMGYSVKADTTEIQIGDESGYDYYSPSNTLWCYSVTQQIYTASELNNIGGTIEYISFNMYSQESITRTVAFYLMDTDKTSFANGTDWLSFADATLCYRGSYTFVHGWNQINLSTPFSHDASKNLAVMCVDTTGSWSSRNFYSFSSSGSSNQRIVVRNDDSAYDIYNLPTASQIYNTKNEIRIGITSSDTPVDPSGSSSGAPSLTPEQLRLLSVQNFVENLYISVLGRQYDVTGRDAWVDLIINHNGTGSQVVRGFLNSPEFIGRNQSDEAFVITLYKVFFNRTPAASEVANWTSALANGASRNQVISGFTGSAEWAQVCTYYGINV